MLFAARLDFGRLVTSGHQKWDGKPTLFCASLNVTEFAVPVVYRPRFLGPCFKLIFRRRNSEVFACARMFVAGLGAGNTTQRTQPTIGPEPTTTPNVGTVPPPPPTGYCPLAGFCRDFDAMEVIYNTVYAFKGCTSRLVINFCGLLQKQKPGT